MAEYDQRERQTMTDTCLAGLRILLVEDEALVGMLLEDMLETFRCQVIGRAARLASARDLVQREGFDCAILDINVHGEPVYPVADLLAARAIPFAFVTGYGRAEVAERFRHLPVLQKPFKPSELRDLLMALAERGTPPGPG